MQVLRLQADKDMMTAKTSPNDLSVDPVLVAFNPGKKPALRPSIKLMQHPMILLDFTVDDRGLAG